MVKRLHDTDWELFAWNIYGNVKGVIDMTEFVSVLGSSETEALVPAEL